LLISAIPASPSSAVNASFADLALCVAESPVASDANRRPVRRLAGDEFDPGDAFDFFH